MASLTNDGGKSWRIQIGADKGRKTIRFRGAQRDAERFRDRVERLAASWPSVPADLVEWLNEQPDSIYKRLVKAGIAKPKQSTVSALGPFIDAFLASRPDLKPNTMMNMLQVRRHLVDHFGEGRDMRTITPGEAEQWHAYMVERGLGDNTVRRHIGRARQLFKAAIRRELIRGVNPFEGMSATVRADKTRQFFVTADMAEKVLDACPDAQWKLMFALSRYGGLRCPSEHLALKWGDIDFEHGRIHVRSPKTEHYEGKESRIIPLFPELRPLLQDVFDQAEPGTEYIISRYRDSACNLRTQLGRIIRKAGLKVWQKPWHNLRSTRQTELAEKYPIHVVCAWIGNSRAVAQEHYLQVTDAHFDRALAPTPEGSAKAAHFPAQYGVQPSVIGCKAQPANVQNPQENALSCTPLHSLTQPELPPTGFEPVACGFAGRRFLAGLDHLITPPVWGVGCRALPLAGCGLIVEATHPLVSTPSAGHNGLAGGLARDCPRGWRPRWGFPEFTRCSPSSSEAGSQFLRKPPLYPTELRGHRKEVSYVFAPAAATPRGMFPRAATSIPRPPSPPSAAAQSMWVPMPQYVRSLKIVGQHHRLVIKQVRGRAFGDDQALVQNNDALAQLDHQLQKKRGHQLRQRNPPQRLLEFAAGFGVETAGRLVQHENGRLARQHARQTDAALFPAAEVVGGAMLKADESHLGQRFGDARGDLRVAEAQLLRAEGDILVHGRAE